MEYVVWFSIGLAFLAAFILVFVWPMTLYNVFWVSVTDTTTSLPIYKQAAGNPGLIYYVVNGKARVLYGVLCLISALSIHLTVGSFIWFRSDDEYATTFQSYSIMTWVVSNFIMALGGQIFAGRINYHEIDQDGGMFFWKGLFRRLRSYLWSG